MFRKPYALAGCKLCKCVAVVTCLTLTWVRGVTIFMGSSKVWGMMGLKFAFCTVWVVLKKKTVPELKKKKKKNSKVRTVHVLVIPRVA